MTSFAEAEKRRVEMTTRRKHAHAILWKAIRHGWMPHPKTLKCQDCGKDAECYDHRDYGEPLAVNPVCRKCNNKRGPALPYDGLFNGWNNRLIATANRLSVINEKPLTAPRGRPKKQQ